MTGKEGGDGGGRERTGRAGVSDDGRKGEREREREIERGGKRVGKE